MYVLHTMYCTYVSLHARYYHDRQLVDGVTASFWSKQTVECGKQFTGKSSASKVVERLGKI